jgi:hypothetical protein
MVLLEGMPPIPVRYSDWREWRDVRLDDLPPAPLAPATGCFCAACWGQGRMLEEARNGEGLVPVACADCGGSGWSGATG